jgi:lysophospholipase L1-like esterase
MQASNESHHACGRSEKDAPPPPPGRGSPWVNLGLLFASVVLTLLFVEVGYRAVAGQPIFALVNWRAEEVVTNRLGDRALYDHYLGWVVKPWHDEDGYTSIDHGVRQNFDETTIRTGAVLAVGDSFTEGWEVGNSESWPAYLEKLSGVPIVNAGIGGYGSDQIIMRAELMLDIVRPKVLIVGMLELDIFRSGHSHFGAPKPYFVIENGELQFHPPGPLEPRTGDTVTTSLAFMVRDTLGYSAAVDHVLGRLAPTFWYAERSRDQKVVDDEAEVICRLLARLKKRTDREGVHLALFMQHGAELVMGVERSTPNARRVIACSKAAGIRVVDQFQSLWEIARGNPNAMRTYYMNYGDRYGHMSAAGNAHAADLLAHSLRDWLTELARVPPASLQDQPVVAGDSPTATEREIR